MGNPAKVEGPAARPCGSCPYRRDVPSGVWHPDEYDKLPPYDGPTWEQPPGVFLCHQQDGRMCAGWCGTHDMDEALAIRLLGATGNGEAVNAALDYVSPIPLFDSGAEAAEHGLRDVEHPTAGVAVVHERLRRKGLG